MSRERVLAATAQPTLDALRDVLDSGDRTRQEVVASGGRLIGMVLANVCTALDVDGAVIGGDLLSLGTHLTSPLETSFAEHLMPSRAHRISLRSARIRQVDGALGGIALVLRDPTISLPVPSSHTTTASRTSTGRLSS